MIKLTTQGVQSMDPCNTPLLPLLARYDAIPHLVMQIQKAPASE